MVCSQLPQYVTTYTSWLQGYLEDPGTYIIYIYMYIYIYNDHLNLAKIVDISFVLVVDNLCESSVFSSSF